MLKDPLPPIFVTLDGANVIGTLKREESFRKMKRYVLGTRDMPLTSLIILIAFSFWQMA